MKPHPQSYRLRLRFHGISHGLKSVHRTLFALSSPGPAFRFPHAYFQTKKRRQRHLFLFGAGYGNRFNQGSARSSPRRRRSSAPHIIGSIPVSYFYSKKQDHPGGMAFLFGAGYGNRTRLHGLGSRCITDIRTLHRSVL